MPIAPGFANLQPKYILGTDQWISAVAEQIVGEEYDRVNQLRDHFPFYATAAGRTMVVPRVESMAKAGFVGNETVATDASFAVLEDPAAEFDLTSLVGTVDLAHYPQDVQSYAIDQLQLQIEIKKIALRIAFWHQFFQPRSARSFRGLPDLVAANQTVDAGGGLQLEAVDELVGRVTEADAEMDRKVLVMTSRAFMRYVQLVRAAGGPLQYTTRAGRRYAMHNGVAILVSDYIPAEPVGDDGAVATSMWCMTLGVEDKGVFGAVPPGIGDNGLVVEQVQGELEVDSAVHRVRWYMTLVLGHTRGLALLENVKV